MLHIQHHLPGGPLCLVHLQLHIPAHHEPGHLLHRGGGHIHGTHVLALAQNGAPVGHGLNFRQLVGDEQDALTLGLEAPHDFHELVNLLGGQHGGGLIEDQDLIVPVEHLQDLHPLLHTYGDVGDLGVRVNFQVIPLGQSQDLFPGLLFLQDAHVTVLLAQDDVVQDGETFHQLKVLVYHADVQGRGVVGVPDLNHLAIFLNDALLRLIEAE